MASTTKTESAANNLSGREDRFRVIFDAVNDGIFISDPATGRFIEVNEAACRMFGYSRGELIGRGVDDLSSGIHPYTMDMAIELNEKARLSEPQIFEWQCRTKTGALFPTEFSLRYAEFDDTPVMVGIVRDIAERKRLDAEIVYLAQHDSLTGLANRAMFTATLEGVIAQSLRNGRKFAVLSLDLDHFKDVNDTRGHLTGDRLLRMVATRLQSTARVGAKVARFGGDEFAILLDEMSEPEQIALVANRLITEVTRPFLIDGQRIHVGASIGIAIYGEESCDSENLLSHADIALYRAKTEGGQSYRFYSDEMNQEVRSRVKLTDELRVAIQTGQLFLVYQPQVKIDDQHIVGVEALVRWRHPGEGILTPGAFLPVAESSGLIADLGQWVLREACRQGREWLDAGIKFGTMGVNLSSAQFRAPLELEKFILAVLAETGFPSRLLELEITENTLINLSPDHEHMVQRLRSAGIRFSLDDFGTGYSSLNYLRRFPIDRIKIAQEFIGDLQKSGKAASIVKLILGLSRDFGNEVIAEGVETAEQLELLREWNCTHVQGFYFSRPLTAKEIFPTLTATKAAAFREVAAAA